jgi:hypothetical protein
MTIEKIIERPKIMPQSSWCSNFGGQGAYSEMESESMRRSTGSLIEGGQDEPVLSTADYRQPILVWLIPAFVPERDAEQT